MDAALNAQGTPPRMRVSVIARLIAALSYTIPLIGGALSSILLFTMFRALSQNEAAGIEVVMAGLKEARLPAIVSLYLAAVLGFVVIVVLVVRMIVETKTASPPFWFFGVGGILCLIPAGIFWKADLLVLEGLSPGSQIAANGLGSVGSEINLLAGLSIASAMLVFVFLLVASVVPFSSRQSKKWGSLITAAAIEILLIATAVVVPFLITEPQRKKETVNLPTGVKYAVEDNDIDNGSSLILLVASDNKLYLEEKQTKENKLERTEKPVSKEELPDKLTKFFETKTPDKRIVYLKADVGASNEIVLQILEIVRKADIDKVGLVVLKAKNELDSYQISASKFDVKLPSLPDKNEKLKPNPNVLIVFLDKDEKLKLNVDEMGTISSPERLSKRLFAIFKERENNGVFREGTNEVEKTVSLSVFKSGKYGDFIKLVEAVKAAGAEPIEIQLDPPFGSVELVPEKLSN